MTIVQRATFASEEARSRQVAVDIAMDLFAMTCAISRALRTDAKGARAPLEDAGVLADLFCRDTRRAVTGRFRALFRNDDARKYRIGQSVLAGDQAWLETGTIGLGRSIDELRPLGETAAAP